MTFFDPKEEVLDIKLTQHGRYMLSIGKLKPTYYSFFDEDVLYDAQYGGVTETKNEAEPRIQDQTPSLKTQICYSGREEQVFSTVSDEEAQARAEVYDKLNTFTNPLGTTSLDSTKTPAFQIQFLQGEVKDLEYNLSGSPASGKVKSRSQQLQKIPQIESEVEFKITVYDPEEPKLPFLEDPALTPSSIYDDGLAVAIGGQQILLIVEEKNAPFEFENFDIEVYEITDETGNFAEQILDPLSFAKPIEMVENNLLIDEEEALRKAGRTKGATLDLDPTYVEYYFNVNVDDEIDKNLICQSIKTLKSKNIIIDSDLECPDLTTPFRRNVYFSDAEDDECLDNL